MLEGRKGLGATVLLGLLTAVVACSSSPASPSPPDSGPLITLPQPHNTKLYAACDADDDCKSGSCLGAGVPVGARVGVGSCTQSCETDADCPDGVCVTADEQQLCLEPCQVSTPDQRACVDGRPILCSEPDAPCPDCGCGKEEYCADSRCLPRLEIGETCTDRAGCTSLQCCQSIAGAEATCSSADAPCPGAATALCNSNADCLPGLHCTGVNRGYCECDDIAAKGCYWPTCTVDRDCQQYGPGAVCFESIYGHICIVRDYDHGSGADCSDDTWCKSKSCVDGQCTGAADVEVGKPCEDTSWCHQENVFNDLKCCRKSETDDAQVCFDTTHTFDVCRKTVGEKCTVNSECFSSRCSGSVCLAP